MVRSSVRRPILRWYGGKWRIAPWIISHFPPHRVYVEPFGGAASVLLRKVRSHVEVYNDLDGEVVNLFRVLRSKPLAARLLVDIKLTPFSRREFFIASKSSRSKYLRALNIIKRSFFGFGSLGKKRTTGFKSNSKKSKRSPAWDWKSYPDSLVHAVERLRGVMIEDRPAQQIIKGHDSTETLFYCDPPYVMSSRSKKEKIYYCEMTDQDHEELAAALRKVKGHVVISGYRTELYNRLYKGWDRFDCKTRALNQKETVESIWVKPQKNRDLDLFNVR